MDEEAADAVDADPCDVFRRFAEENTARRRARWLNRLPGDWFNILKRKFRFFALDGDRGTLNVDPVSAPMYRSMYFSPSSSIFSVTVDRL